MNMAGTQVGPGDEAEELLLNGARIFVPDQNGNIESMAPDDYSQFAMALIRGQKTMVLATCRNDRPWCAPVYYVYVQPGFCFFSSPRSRHIRDIRNHAGAAAAIFADSHRWEEIQGVQMTGQIEEIHGPKVRLRVTGRYLAKFPLARDFLSVGVKKIPDLRDSVGLYRFVPRQIHYVNNRMGFGRRVLMAAFTADQKET